MILDKFSLKDKVAVVTGANTGLGQGISVALAQAGAKVCGAARRSCEDTAKKIEDFGGEFKEIIADLSDRKSVDILLSEALEAYGRVDILVNNAGMILREDSVNVSDEYWYKVIELNQNTVFFLCREFGKHFISQGGGKIINIASMLSFQGGIRVASYCASKSAVAGLTKALANEWAKYNINVNAIAPGYMATNNTSQLRSDEDRSEAIIERIPAGRWGTPEDIAGAAVFLSSEASSYINGFTLAVDGGWLAR
ncbi:MAG: 2-dehydro-3-deoxy-D-gluconate 5-dehydrogenase KduD [Firmicutes bacterium]|nr:2-dehydro-3-deoxy-D-gluconate 5-dehydrogenase KduD [Bacillota bacterium]